MRRLAKAAAVLLAFVASTVVGLALVNLTLPWWATPFEQAVYTSEDGTLRVSAFGEVLLPLGGVVFLFEFKTKDRRDWERILLWRIDDPFPIDTVVGTANPAPGVQYVYFDAQLVITWDGGLNWQVVDGAALVPNPHRYDVAIQDVTMDGDGNGRLILIRGGDRLRYISNDFGRTWTPGSSP